ncbi:MAG: hypothetical protein AAFO58_11210, partial [Pseudomonadota bacterium]
QRQNELTIAAQVLNGLSDAGYEFAVSYEHGYDVDDMEWTRDVEVAKKHLHACDEEHIMVRREQNAEDPRADAWVFLIYGNGNDGLHVISDYTTNLEPIIAPIMAQIKAAERAAA